MLLVVIAGLLYLFGLIGLLYGLAFESKDDPRFEGDKLIYRS